MHTIIKDTNSNYITDLSLNSIMSDMKCYPINDNGSKADTVELYQLDDNSLAMKNLYSMIINFFIFIFIIIISITLVPFFYKNVIMAFISLIYSDNCGKKNGLKTMDITINVVLLALFLGILVDGTRKMESDGGRIEFFIGLYAIIFLLISDIIMYSYKNFFQDYRFDYDCKSGFQVFLENIIKILGIFFKFIYDNFKTISILFFACLLFIYVLSIILYFTHIINDLEFSITFTSMVFAFVVAVILTISFK